MYWRKRKHIRCARYADILEGKNPDLRILAAMENSFRFPYFASDLEKEAGESKNELPVQQ